MFRPTRYCCILALASCCFGCCLALPLLSLLSAILIILCRLFSFLQKQRTADKAIVNRFEKKTIKSTPDTQAYTPIHTFLSPSFFYLCPLCLKKTKISTQLWKGGYGDCCCTDAIMCCHLWADAFVLAGISVNQQQQRKMQSNAKKETDRDVNTVQGQRKPLAV